jgi:rhodanese-related sulfurtransferase
MKRITYQDMVAEIAPQIKECFPWDVEEKLEAGEEILFLDVRENQEYDTMHIDDSLHVPRGILETAVEWDHEETEPELVEARDKQIVVVCRSGSRSVFATYTLMQMGYQYVTSLKTGLRGWNESTLSWVTSILPTSCSTTSASQRINTWTSRHQCQPCLTTSPDAIHHI